MTDKKIQIGGIGWEGKKSDKWNKKKKSCESNKGKKK